MAHRRLIVCCDGTENDAISSNNPLTNVARLARCLDNKDCDEELRPITQIVHYQTGVATGTDFFTNKYDAASGRGLHIDVRRAYSFICTNFDPGDTEIYLVGFSRGAYTVKVLAAFIEEIGVLVPTGMVHLHWLYEQWLAGTINRRKGDYSNEAPCNILLTHLDNANKICRPVEIEACAVWDTVSATSLGPKDGALSRLKNQFPRNIRNVFHALALNERRNAFKPDIWSNWSPRQNVKQCWFLDVHSNIGGGYEDLGLANITFIWMLAQLKTYTQLKVNNIRYQSLLLPFNPSTSTGEGYGLHPGLILSGFSAPLPEHTHGGNVMDSVTGIFKAMPRSDRTEWKHPIGVEDKTDGGRIPAAEVAAANEYAAVLNDQKIHWTVRVMLEKKFSSCPQLAQCFTTIDKSGNNEHRAHRSQVSWCLDTSSSGERTEYLHEEQSEEDERIMFSDWIAAPTYATPSKAKDPVEIAKSMHVGSRGGWAEAFVYEAYPELDESEPQEVISPLANLLQEYLSEAESPSLMFGGIDPKHVGRKR